MALGNASPSVFDRGPESNQDSAKITYLLYEFASGVSTGTSSVERVTAHTCSRLLDLTTACPLDPKLPASRAAATERRKWLELACADAGPERTLSAKRRTLAAITRVPCSPRSSSVIR